MNDWRQLKVPRILDDYLDDTEQVISKMSKSRILNEAEWCLWNQRNIDDETLKYHHSSVKALEVYIEKLKSY